MKVLNFGSLNFDNVYEVDHFVKPKETLSAESFMRGFGGKGLNQSIALAKAGTEAYHAGKVGFDGDPFFTYLNEHGVNTKYLINNDATSESAKNVAAKRLGIPVITEVEFISKFIKK